MDLSRGIDLEQYKTQAKELLRQSRAGDADALRRIAHHHRRYATPSPPDPQTLRLADAQLVIARENGLRSWTRFKSYLVFLQARRAFDHGDLPALTAVLDAHPTVVGYRCHESEPTEFGFDIYASGYFMGATLLHHVAGNPIRCPLPANVVDLTRLLLARGADPNARCGEPDNVGSTIGLLLTSQQASEAGVALPLIEILRAAGAAADSESDLLSAPLWNQARATAEALVRQGVPMDLRHAAGLGRLDVLDDLLGKGVDDLLLEEALIYACVQNELGSVRRLVAHGAHGDRFAPAEWSGAERGAATALHQAANRGFTQIVAFLLDHGADATVVDKRFGGTPSEWAAHGGQRETVDLIAAHTARTATSD